MGAGTSALTRITQNGGLDENAIEFARRHGQLTFVEVLETWPPPPPPSVTVAAVTAESCSSPGS